MTKKNFVTPELQEIIADATTEPAAAEEAQEPQEAQQMQEAQEPHKKNRPRKTYNKQEADDLLQSRQTRGRKDVKLQRINLALTPELYDFIKVTSKAAGMTNTDLINMILEKYRTTHPDLYEKAVAFRNSLEL